MTESFVIFNQNGQAGSVLANPFVANNVNFFVQDTPPTALATGDRWTKTTDNGLAGSAGDYFWTGSLWVTEKMFFLQTGTSRTLAQVNSDILEGGSFGNLAATVSPRSGMPFGFNTVVYLDHVGFVIYTPSFSTPNFSVSNSFELWPALADSALLDAFAVTVNNTGIIEIPYSTKVSSFAVSTAITLTNSNVSLGLRVNCFVRNVVGTPLFAGVGSITIGIAIGIRGVHP